MGLRGFLTRLFRRQQRTPLDEARAAGRKLARKGHEQRRNRPPHPNERSEGGVTWGGVSFSNSMETDGNGCGTGGSD